MLNKRFKISLITRSLLILFLFFSLFLPIEGYITIILYLLFELSYLTCIYFNYLNELYDIDYEETFSQRQIIAFHFYLTITLTIIILICLYFYDKNLDYIIYDCINDISKTDINITFYYLVRVTITFFIISKIHEHVLLNKTVGFENNYPPLCKIISNIINKIKYKEYKE